MWHIWEQREEYKNLGWEFKCLKCWLIYHRFLLKKRHFTWLAAKSLCTHRMAAENVFRVRCAQFPPGRALGAQVLLNSERLWQRVLTLISVCILLDSGAETP